jgi:hypothetical protein
LQLVHKCFDSIVTHPKHLDLQMQIEF